jgi:hypothetical protein
LASIRTLAKKIHRREEETMITNKKDDFLKEILRDARKNDIIIMNEPINTITNITLQIEMLEARQKYLETGLDKVWNETQAIAKALDKTLEQISRLITVVEANIELQKIKEKTQKIREKRK